jgi:hypothetical protein
VTFPSPLRGVVPRKTLFSPFTRYLMHFSVDWSETWWIVEGSDLKQPQFFSEFFDLDNDLETCFENWREIKKKTHFWKKFLYVSRCILNPHEFFQIFRSGGNCLKCQKTGFFQRFTALFSVKLSFGSMLALLTSNYEIITIFGHISKFFPFSGRWYL